jgi:hypothetical protein
MTSSDSHVVWHLEMNSTLQSRVATEASSYRLTIAGMQAVTLTRNWQVGRAGNAGILANYSIRRVLEMLRSQAEAVVVG